MLIEDFKAKYIEEPAKVRFFLYPNNRKAITLFSAHNNDRLLVATVNLPDEKIDDDEVFIKGWSENEGVPEELIRAGLIGPELRRVKTGFVEASVHKLLFKGNKNG